MESCKVRIYIIFEYFLHIAFVRYVTALVSTDIDL